ncbi:CDP-glycerol glycerophosphotransferase family protein [Neobacillus cucumis]|uniref:CDP-glycerol glycerophosphotransferase family protein n=1 Tax=Neobacillus cucumis TaxID=1740721 RepID=UPI002853390E|nr:CDP-glycerol glycerophosphotransferase family protein [Neobacillus cucumis]MDR4949942.1 CDP-glycerol glycerophosphotransferase family protein [Neobacillus cucumis]
MPDPFKISSFELEDNTLKIIFKDRAEVSDTVKVLLNDRNFDDNYELSIEVKKFETGTGFAINLDVVPFKHDSKSIIDVFLYTDEDENTPVRLLKTVPVLKDRSMSYSQTSYQIDEINVAVPYLTTKNELSILYGRKGQLYKSFCTYINDKTLIDDLSIQGHNLSLTFSSIDFNQLEDYYFVIRNRGDKNDSKLIDHKKINANTVLLDLLSRNWSIKSRYDLFVNIKVGRVIRTLRVLINEDTLGNRNFGSLVLDDGLQVMPYITTKGEISFVGVDTWLYEYELSSKNIHDLYFDKIDIKDDKLFIRFSADVWAERVADNPWKLNIKNNSNNNFLSIEPKIENNSVNINLKDVFFTAKTSKNQKWEFYIKVYNQESGQIEIYKLKKQGIMDIQRNVQSLQLTKDSHLMVYISAKQDLGIQVGDPSIFQRQNYTKVETKIAIEGLNISEGRLQFKLADIKPNKIEWLKVILKARKSNEKWEEEINSSSITTQGVVTLQLGEFVEAYQYTKLRWDISVEVAHDGIIETGKIGLFYDELAAKHLRYLPAFANRGNNVFVPYLTIYNELALVVNDPMAINNEMISHEISITNFDMNGPKLTGTVNVTLTDVDSFTINNIMLKFRGKADELIEYELPVDSTDSKGSKCAITFEIDVTNYEFQPFYWDLYLLIDINGAIYPVKIKDPTSEVKNNIDNKISKYSFTFDNGYFVYPYISGANTLALTYREKPSYESNAYKIKENIAYYTYRLFKKYFDRKNIWLGYEKFAEGAQDNGYYFFKYCYDNNKKSNFYYVIKKDSPDFENVAHMQDKVVEFMSFRYMLYMYAAKLLVSSESKGHIYDIRIQKGKLLNALKKKKHVFLQHGVTALKRVDYVFKKTKNNAVDLFVATSDYEKNIIKKYFGYNDDEIIVTGFCRWDVLEDKSGENKEIFVMPTWRTWMDDLPEDQFIESDYYKNYVGFFRSERLKELLAKHNVKLSFYIHPKFKSYIDAFHVDNENIKIYQYGESKVNELLMHSSMLVTDYSSVAWEMFYQKKPVIFFQFDVDKYNAFQGSYLDMDTELFGDRVLTVDQLVDSVEEYMERDFKEKDKFGSLRNKYFKYVDQNNCERTYKAIVKSLKNKKKK